MTFENPFENQSHPKPAIATKWLRGLVLAVLLMVGGGILLLSHAATLSSAREYQIKAVYLYNFTLFITWPKSAFSSYRAPFRICILGDDPFKKQIDIVVRNEKAQNRPIVVERIREVKPFCQIVYISRSEQRHLPDIIAALEQHPILSVSDLPEFVVNGGMIKFYTRRKQVRLAIDPQTLEETGLQASANLLRVSKIVRRSR